MVKIHLSNHATECLVTNLTAEEFTTEDIGYIYYQHWGIETAFEILKNKLQCENFTGIISDLVEQDIYASIFVFNLSMHLVADSEVAYETQKDDVKKTKHTMAINRNFAIGILKESLITIILDSANERISLIADMVAKIKNKLLPVRPERSYTKTKSRLAGKYSNSHKRPY